MLQIAVNNAVLALCLGVMAAHDCSPACHLSDQHHELTSLAHRGLLRALPAPACALHGVMPVVAP